jgi:hypothetical protein
MAFNDKQKRRVVAITKQLKEQKGITVKKAELLAGINDFKKTQQEILKVKSEYSDCPLVQEEADKEHKKLQKIIDDLNEYMKVLHPEGLLDMGSSSSPVGQG